MDNTFHLAVCLRVKWKGYRIHLAMNNEATFQEDAQIM